MLVIRGIIADIVAGGAIEHIKAEDRGGNRIIGIGLKQISARRRDCTSEISWHHGGRTLGLTEIHAKVIEQPVGGKKCSAGCNGPDVGSSCAVSGSGIKIKRSILRSIGWSVIATDK